MLLNICTNESPEDNQCDRVVVDSFEKGGGRGGLYRYSNRLSYIISRPMQA